MENQEFEKQEELEKELEQTLEEETPKYVPRPAWQVWAARIGLVLFVFLILMYYWNIARGGL